MQNNEEAYRITNPYKDTEDTKGYQEYLYYRGNTVNTNRTSIRKKKKANRKANKRARKSRRNNSKNK